jgi:putative transposase
MAWESTLVERLHKFARTRRRRGYRLIYEELRREGLPINHKRVYRLWKREGLRVPVRTPRRRLRGQPAVRAFAADRPNGVWCLDFVQDRTLDGRLLRVLCVTDEFTRQSLAIEVGRSLPSGQVCAVLEGLLSSVGVPGALRMDNGPEFVALAVRGLCHRYGINAAYIEPGKPWQNGYAESFHARLRDEFMNGEVFVSVLEAQVRLGMWRRYWNEERLHSSLGYQPPREFAALWAATAAQSAETGAKTKVTSGI